jgi:hypothetical protein
MRRNRAFAAVGVLVGGLLADAPAWAWQRSEHEHIAADAVIFLPPILRGLIRLYGDDFAHGVAEAGPFTKEVLGVAPSIQAEAVAQSLEREMQDVTTLIRTHKPFKTVFYRFGRLVGPVAELNVPLNYARGDALYLSEVRAGFESLSTAASPKFRILWGGYQDDLMHGVSASKYFLDSSHRARDLYPVLYEAFVVEGKVVPARSFDFTSIPFGVASMAYSRSVNSIVNVWCAIWREAGGDMSGRPY